MQTEEPKSPKNRTITQAIFSATHVSLEKIQKLVEKGKEEEDSRVRWDGNDTVIKKISPRDLPESGIKNLKEDSKEEKNLLHLNLGSLPVVTVYNEGKEQSSGIGMEPMEPERIRPPSAATSSGSSPYSSRFFVATTSMENGQSNIFQSHSGNNMLDPSTSPRIKNAESSYLNSDETQSFEITDNKLKKSKPRRSSSISWGKKDKTSTEKIGHLDSSGEKKYKIGIQLFISCQYQEAFSHFEKAAAQEYPSAFVWLGIFYGCGFVGKIDKTESQKWYEKAARKMDWFEEQAGISCLDAQNNLGILYAIGIGLKKDEKKSFINHKYSAEGGYQLAQLNLGICYRDGIGVEPDSTEATKFFKLAADQGNAMAQYQRGMCYHDANGVIKDYRMAVECLVLSANQRYAPAQNELGLCYYNGKGVMQNYSMAVKNFQLAADQGYAPAQNWLAFCYYEGNGVTQDYKMAVKYYQLAVNQGHECAKRLLKILLVKEPSLAEKTYIGTPINFYKAAEAKIDVSDSHRSHKESERKFFGFGKI